MHHCVIRMAAMYIIASSNSRVREGVAHAMHAHLWGMHHYTQNDKEESVCKAKKAIYLCQADSICKPQTVAVTWRYETALLAVSCTCVANQLLYLTKCATSAMWTPTRKFPPGRGSMDSASSRSRAVGGSMLNSLRLNPPCLSCNNTEL